MEPSRENPAAPARTGRIRQWANGRRRGLTVALVLLALLALAARAGLLFSGTTQLTSSIQANSGHGYIARLQPSSELLGALFINRGDSVDRPTQSQLQLFEDGKPLPRSHAQHVEIAETGAGRYSHWGADYLYFSALDNSNPMTNGRAYTAQYPLHLRGPILGGVLLVIAGCFVLLYPAPARRFVARLAEKQTAAPAQAVEATKLHPAKAFVFSVLSLVILSIMGIGLTVTADMAWRAIFAPMDAVTATDVSSFAYRDYLVTTQPANLVVGNSKHPAEAYYERTCVEPDGTAARFNSLGFRSPEFVNLAPKQPNEIRIIVTGGSVSMSHNVSETCTLRANLERLLAQRLPGKDIKVFVLGSGAWKSFQELIAIQRYDHDIKPDLIVAFDGFNDITHSFGGTDAYAPYAGWRMQEGYVRLHDWVWGGPLASFQGLRIVRDISLLLDKASLGVIRPAAAADDLPEFTVGRNMATRFELPVDRQRIAGRTDFDPLNRIAVDQYLRNMKLLQLAAQNSGSRILHVLQPMLYLKEPMSAEERKRLDAYTPMVNYSIQGYLRMSNGLQKLTESSKFARYLDLSAPFQGDAKTYFYDYCHMNPDGYRIISARVAEAIAEMLEGPPPG